MVEKIIFIFTFYIVFDAKTYNWYNDHYKVYQQFSLNVRTKEKEITILFLTDNEYILFMVFPSEDYV